MSPPSEATDAVVLRSVDYRDADRVVTFLTRGLGKVSVLARGARNSKRRFPGGLPTCSVMTAHIAPGRGELDRLAEARVTRSFLGLLSDLTALSLAGAGLELVREAVPPREPDERVFAETVRFLELLDSCPGQEEVLIAFQVRLMSVLGFSPELARCGRTGKVAPDGQAAYFDPELGSVVSREAGGGRYRFSGSLRSVLRQCVTPRWTEIDFDWPESDRAEARAALAAFIRHRIGKELKGGRVVAQVQEVSR